MKKLIAVATLFAATAAHATTINVGHDFSTPYENKTSAFFVDGTQDLNKNVEIKGKLAITANNDISYNVGGRLKADLATELALINFGGVDGYLGAAIVGHGSDSGFQVSSGVEAEMFTPGLYVDTGVEYTNLSKYQSLGAYAESTFQFDQHLSAGIKVSVEKEIGFGFKVGYSF